MMQGEGLGQRSLRGGKSALGVQQNEEPSPKEPENSDRSSDFVNIKYLNFDNMKSVIFTQLESSTRQKKV